MQPAVMSDKERRQTSNEHARDARSRDLPENMGRDPEGHGDPRTGPDVGVGKNTGPGPGGGTKDRSGAARSGRRG